MSTKTRVAILFGSESDRTTMQETAKVLDSFGIGYEMEQASAHRSPDKVRDIVRGAPERGVEVFVAAAGMANHLAGAVAAHTSLPVIGVPLGGSPLGGADALLSTVQMPAGVPVATVAVGKSGAENAAILAAQILAVGDARLAARLEEYKQTLARGVAEKDARLQKERRAVHRSAEPHETRGGVREGRTARGDA